MNKKLIVSAAAIGMLTACASDPHQRAKAGAAIGAIAGAVIGHQIDDDKGRYIGGVIGAIAGGAVGNYMDQQQRELEALLANEQASGELAIRRISEDSVLIGVASEASFDVNEFNLKSEATPVYSKISNVLKQYDKTVIHVVGHTDSSGAADYNQELSEKRANTVSNFMQGQGIIDARLYEEGRGETQPRATNDTAEGKRKNRRVDIIVQAVVEGDEQRATMKPRSLRY